MSSTPSAPEPGQILAGKYLVEQVLGVGGMGIVVAATHLQLEQRVAIKYLLPSALMNPEVVERFAREARAAAKIRGEHVARVIDVGQFDDGAPYMVMEHLDGHDLARHLELHGPLPIEDACRFMLETCEALAEAHAGKVVHRDLKPSNLFLAKQPDKSAIIKVLDFGISKTGDTQSASLTKTSALMGTAFYMSPEQLTNPKAVDHRSDIWTLGIILYELLAGRQPFVGESIPEIIGAILSNRPESVRTLRPEVPLGLDAVIAQCMRSKAAERYPSVARLAAAIGPFAHPRDRFSIEISARVLGESLRPLEVAPSPPGISATLVLASPARSPLTSTLGAPAVDTGTAPAVAAVTTEGLTSSAVTATKKPPFALLGTIGVIMVLAVGITVKLTVKPSAPATAATGLVAAPLPPHVDSQTAAANANANANAKSTAEIAPTAAASSTAAAPPPSNATVANPALARARTGAAASARAVSPTASASVVAPLVTAASSTSKNPLQMGIK